MNKKKKRIKKFLTPTLSKVNGNPTPTIPKLLQPAPLRPGLKNDVFSSCPTGAGP
jgi:hypothetical protein